jgi:hypothetical protein
MSRLLFFLLLLISFHGNAQTFLGNSKTEILASAYENFEIDKISIKKFDEKSSYISIVNSYETLYYYLIDDICVEFLVEKPYSCNCLEVDITAYDENCIATGEKEWVSKDYLKKYKIVLNESTYAVSVVSIEDKKAIQNLQKIFTVVEK